jgi:hypothetical protein
MLKSGLTLVPQPKMLLVCATMFITMVLFSILPNKLNLVRLRLRGRRRVLGLKRRARLLEQSLPRLMHLR